MGFDGIKRSFGKSAMALWRVDHNTRKKVIFAHNNPARAASHVAKAVAQTTLLRPAKLVGVVTLDVGKAVIEPVIWAAKGAKSSASSARDNLHMRRMLADARANQRWVVPSDVEGEAPQVDDALVNQLKHGIIAALAKADALHRTHKTVKVNWAAYGSHTGYMLAVKAAKVVLVAAALHTPGINHLALAHYLSPASEERLINAVGLKTVASQAGVGAGLLAAGHDGFSKSLRNTNLWEKDLETRQYQKEQVAVRKDLLLLEKALKSIQVLQSEKPDANEDPKAASQRHDKAVRHVQTGLLAAQRLQLDISGNQLGARFNGLSFNTESLGRRADNLLNRYALSASAESLGFSELAALPPLTPDPFAPTLAASQQRVPQSVVRYIQRRKLQAEEARNSRLEARYEAELDHLKELAPNEDERIDPELRKNHVDNKRALAKAQRRLASTRRRVLDAAVDPEKAAARIEALQKRIEELQDKVAGFRAYASHPAVAALDSDWRMILPRYTAEANLLNKQSANINKKIASIEAGLNSAVGTAQHAVMVNRVNKLVYARSIIKLKRQQIGLDLALAASQGRQMPSEDSAATALMTPFTAMDPVRNRREYAMCDALVAVFSDGRERSADGQRRSSAYVRPDTAPVGGAPSVVNGILKSAWYSVAVVPLVNLPYWGVVRAHAAWSNYRFIQAVQGATHDA